MPSSYFAVLVSFAIFFFFLNVYILTLLLLHPLASPWWLILSIIGLVGLLYSIRLVRIQQVELVRQKAERDAANQKE